MRCGEPVFDGLSRYAPCAVVEDDRRNSKRKNAQSRRRYAERRARLVHIVWSAVPGASRCALCAERSYHGSAYFKRIPVWDPSWTVIELETGREHGPFTSEADVALFLAFEKIDRDRVEVLCDANLLVRMAARE